MRHDTAQRTRGQNKADARRYVPVRRSVRWEQIVDMRTQEEVEVSRVLDKLTPVRNRAEKQAARRVIARLGKDKDGAYRVANRLDGRA